VNRGELAVVGMKPFSVLIPTLSLGYEAFQSVISVLDRGSAHLVDVQVVVDPRCCDHSMAGKLKEQRHVQLLYPDLPSPSVGALLNHGLRHCETDIILRHDADDIWIAGRDTAQVPLLVQRDGIVVGRAKQLVGSTVSHPALPRIPPGNMWAGALLLGNPVIHPAVGFSRNRLLEALPGPYDEGVQAEDYMLWVRALTAGIPMEVHTDFVTLYRRHAGQASARIESRVAADEMQPILDELALRHDLVSVPNIEVALCQGDCSHTVEDLASFIQACEEAMSQWAATSGPLWRQRRRFMTARMWLPIYRHRRVLLRNPLAQRRTPFDGVPKPSLDLVAISIHAASSCLARRAHTRDPADRQQRH
jgi:hypothetical protein